MLLKMVTISEQFELLEDHAYQVLNLDILKKGLQKVTTRSPIQIEWTDTAMSANFTPNMNGLFIFTNYHILKSFLQLRARTDLHYFTSERFH